MSRTEYFPLVSISVFGSLLHKAHSTGPTSANGIFHKLKAKSSALPFASGRAKLTKQTDQKIKIKDKNKIKKKPPERLKTKRHQTREPLVMSRKQ
jgi:hypothetical protein